MSPCTPEFLKLREELEASRIINGAHTDVRDWEPRRWSNLAKIVHLISGQKNQATCLLGTFQTTLQIS